MQEKCADVQKDFRDCWNNVNEKFASICSGHLYSTAGADGKTHGEAHGESPHGAILLRSPLGRRGDGLCEGSKLLVSEPEKTLKD